MIRQKRKTSVRQQDITDCGAACLASVAAHFGLQMPISRIRQYASTDKKGTNILGMIEAAEKLGLSAKGVRGGKENLIQIPLPAIAHLEIKKVLHHFVVIYRVTGSHVEVMDPIDGRHHKVKINNFLEQWSGVLILLMPDDNFSAGSEKIPVAGRLWFLLKPHRGILMQALIGSAVFTIIGLSTAIYVQLLVDHVLVDGNRNLLNLLSTIMIILLVIQVFIGVSKTVFTLKTGQLIDARLILGYYKHLLTLPQRFFDTMRVGEIISRINDAVKIRAFINDVAIHISVNIFIILFSFALMFTFYWKLGLMMLSIIPVYSLIYFISNRLNRKTQRKLMEHSAELESQLVESLNSVATIKQFGLEDYANMKTETRFIQLLRTVYKSGINSVFSGNSTMFSSRMFTVGLLWTGSYFILKGAISLGELLSFYAILGYFTGPVGSLIEMNKVIQDALIAADRLFEIMDLEKEDAGNRVQIHRETVGDIRFEHIRFRYGTRITVFEDLSLVIPVGSISAFVGESGSGKTTLASILQKMYPVDGGRVMIGDINLAYADPRSLREVISVVPQKIDLFAGTVIDNIAVGVYEPDLRKITGICRDLGIIDFIESLPQGFGTYLGENGALLSGGQKQRIAIARALYRNPQVLILDEATSSLDSASEEYVKRTITLMRDQGKTVMLIAHRLSTVFQADRIFVLHKGSLVETGTHDELIGKKSRYYQLWRVQFPADNLVSKNGTGKQPAGGKMEIVE
jgi:ATP-binding cassette, subfamily C, bacteriocin exporter